ncbi:MAG: nitrate reductase, partial [Clostridiales Family XIII bacterium]|nr:nitrate reductase [Clostridiales Family XIII bacterium]
GCEYEIVRVHIPREFHHLDAIFVIVSDKTCVACTEALPGEFLQLLRDRSFEILDVSIEEARNVGCNVVSLGRDVICSSQRARKLNERLRAMGFTVLEPCLDMLHGQGGGPRCLSFPLERENVFPTS